MNAYDSSSSDDSFLELVAAVCAYNHLKRRRKQNLASTTAFQSINNDDTPEQSIQNVHRPLASTSNNQNIKTQPPLRQQKSTRKKPKHHVNPFLSERQTEGKFVKAFEHMKKHPETFVENFHMNEATFNNLYAKIEEHLLPKRNTRKDAISPQQKLCVVLEYLATGIIPVIIASKYRISSQHMCKIIDEVCDAIGEELKDEVKDSTREGLLEVSQGFNDRWQFPNCTGAMDGRLMRVKAPAHVGSSLEKKKDFETVVLFGIADSLYKFTFLDIGTYSNEHDGNMYDASTFGQILFPPDVVVGNSKLPYFFVGNEAFALTGRVLKPYTCSESEELSEEEAIFNYRLSYANLCVENAFGIVCARWRVLKRKMMCNFDRAQKIVYACCLLHNYLINRNTDYCSDTYGDYVNDEGELIDGEWRSDTTLQGTSLFQSTMPTFNGTEGTKGVEVRDELKRFLNEEGAVYY